ncbi:hypothetical protein OU994_30725 [Pseudoduganella sp. SL102]|uniref:hypothetical protein n=1 Tax=Pseudoduganella sp. SL102 TaxID=2995154 RepID=UPI00248C6ADD|nr:hypothetical protein [Pseudoduganella sp. SL102]WBS02563.1 hypothetical protein OU994_30725 [Pseudoduganella sp. SL102]
MGKRIILSKPSNDPHDPRVGGGALIGGIEDWPVSPDGAPLMLVASIPNSFIKKNTGIEIPENLYTSIFSCYSEKDYFLDLITYHGDADELATIRSGYTKVIQHPPGQEIHQTSFIPPHRIDLGVSVPDEVDSGSRMGGEPLFLQNEELDLGEMEYVLQLMGADFPSKFTGIFALSDAVAYLYLSPGETPNGLFFAQTT